jgi:hypothetical protein
LIDEKERLDGSYTAIAINNGKIPVLELANEGIFQDFVVPIIFSLVGESRYPGRASSQFGPQQDGY